MHTLPPDPCTRLTDAAEAVRLAAAATLFFIVIDVFTGTAVVLLTLPYVINPRQGIDPAVAEAMRSLLAFTALYTGLFYAIRHYLAARLGACVAEPGISSRVLVAGSPLAVAAYTAYTLYTLYGTGDPLDALLRAVDVYVFASTAFLAATCLLMYRVYGYVNGLLGAWKARDAGRLYASYTVLKIISMLLSPR